MKESNFSKKFHEAKNNMKENRSVLRFFVNMFRYVATIIVIYAFTAAAIVSIIPFTVSYLAGIAQISKTTDIISGLIMWGFPSLAATLIITMLVLLIDYKIYKFFKKWLNVDDMKKNAELIEKKAQEFTESDNVKSFSSNKKRKAK